MFADVTFSMSIQHQLNQAFHPWTCLQFLTLYLRIKVYVHNSTTLNVLSQDVTVSFELAIIFHKARFSGYSSYLQTVLCSANQYLLLWWGKHLLSLILQVMLLYLATAQRCSFLHCYPRCDIRGDAAMDTVSQSMIGCPLYVTGVSFWLVNLLSAVSVLDY